MRHFQRRFAALATLALSWQLVGCGTTDPSVPDTKVYAMPQQQGNKTLDIWFDAEDGSKLHGWWLPAASSLRLPCTLVHAPSTAGNSSKFLPQVAWLAAKGVNVLTFDYRGFGQSVGKPSLNGMVADVQAAVLTASRQAGVQSGAIVLLGQGLGGAAAVRATQRTRPPVIRSLFIDSTFATYRGASREVAGRMGLGWGAAFGTSGLPPEADDPVVAIRTLPVSVWILHGTADKVVPLAEADKLFDAAPTPKHLLKAQDAPHVGTLMQAADRAAFLQALQATCSLGAISTR